MRRLDAARLLHALDTEEVSFVVVGGWAVIANGFIRTTTDLDVLIAPGDENRERLLAALEGLDAVDLTGRPVREAPWPADRTLHADTQAGRIDVMSEGAAPLDFATLAADADVVAFADARAPVVSLASIVAFKRLADRPHDRIDLQALTDAHGELPRLTVPGLDD